MPTSPSCAGKATKVASASSTARSGVITLQWKVLPVAMAQSPAGLALSGQLFRLRRRIFDSADVHERLVRQVIPLAVAQLLEGADGGRPGDVDAGEAGELLGDVEGLREEALDLAGAADDDLVLFRQLVDAEDGDDVLEVLVALEDLLDPPGHPVVVLADVLGRDDAAARRQRIDGGVDALLGDAALQVHRAVEVGERGRRGRAGGVRG